MTSEQIELTAISLRWIGEKIARVLRVAVEARYSFNFSYHNMFSNVST
jgi:hypothetical protein